MSEPALTRWRIALRYLNPRNWWWPTEWWRRAALVLLYVLVPLMAVDFFFPPPLTRFQEVSGVVMDRRGAVLRVFPVEDGKWRMRAHVEELDPDFVSALMAYEDKRFMSHGGVDFAALTRAAGSLAITGRIVSGGSTITMQTARLLEPRPRNIGAKLIEAFRAWMQELQERTIAELNGKHFDIQEPVQRVEAMIAPVSWCACSLRQSAERSTCSWRNDGKPQLRAKDFSRMRSWAIATLSARGVTTQCPARNSSDAAGTFSNSVVTATHKAASSDSADTSSYGATI